MTVEEYFVAYLAPILKVHVSGDIPSPMPERFVTLEQTGSSLENYMYKPVIAVQSWAQTRLDAVNLNEQVKAAMLAAVSLPEVSSCRLSTDYNFPDLESKRPRYQAIFEITYLN